MDAKDLKTILLSVTSAGVLWLAHEVVDGHSTEAALREKVAAHESRISGLEAVTAKLAESQARAIAIQETLTKMLGQGRGE